MLVSSRMFAGAALCAAAALTGHAWAQPQPAVSEAAEYTPAVGQMGKDVVWVPTSQALVDRMLDMAKLTPDDILVDLGAGDGRTVITAAKRGATARGIEYNHDMVELAQRAVRKEGVEGRARIEQGDIFESDFSNATVVTLFLLPSLNMRLRPTLLKMKPGTRIVSNSFTMEDWDPDETAHVTEGCTTYCMAYKWVVPAQVAGSWDMDGKRLELTQTFQKLEGMLSGGEAPVQIRDARMDGAKIQFVADGRHYSGQVDGSTMRGTVDGGGTWSARLSGG